MTFHRGDPVTYKGDRYLVKEVITEYDRLRIEDDEGFTIGVPVSDVKPRPYTATVDSDGWVRSIEDTEDA